MGRVGQPVLDHRHGHRDQPDLRDPLGADQDAEHQAADGLPGARARSTPTPSASWPSLLVPLAEAEIPVYTLSTFDTDWIMVRLVDGEKATEAWRRRGHTVTAAVPAKPAKKCEPVPESRSRRNDHHPPRRIHRRRRRRRPQDEPAPRTSPSSSTRAPRSTPPASSPPTAARPTRSCGARRSSRTARSRPSSSTPVAPTATPAPTASRPPTPSPSGSPSSLGIGAIDVVVCSTGLIGLANDRDDLLAGVQTRVRARCRPTEEPRPPRRS